MRNLVLMTLGVELEHRNVKYAQTLCIALLTALEIVLSRFLSISMWNTKIGFSFLPIAVAAILFGPLAAGTVGALAAGTS